jgi:hypothetical protein
MFSTLAIAKCISKMKNISANLPCRNNADCFRRACVAVPSKTAGREPWFSDEFAFFVDFKIFG